MNAGVFIDAHVHVYPGVQAPLLLEAAVRNFARAAAKARASAWQGVLLLTEVAGVDWFGAVANSGNDLDGWAFNRPSRESCSIHATGAGQVLTIVAGRQIVTAERIEVHAFGTLAQIKDGIPLLGTIDAALEAGALVALPWGVGKWLGERGRLVEKILLDEHLPTVLPADNGGRPWFWPAARLHKSAKPVLRGSDPLPLPGEERRVGSSGVWFEGGLDRDAPARDLLDRLRKFRPGEIRQYGSMEVTGRFLRNQLLLRLRKHHLF